MKRIIKKTHRLKDFFNDDIWQIDLEELSKARARFIKYLKVGMITIRTFSSEKIGFQAVALSFFSTMAVVPFIAIAFAITGGLGLDDKLTELLYTYFNNSQQVIDVVQGFAQNIIASAETGWVGLISSLLFAWTVIWMMMSVERVFNNVWRVGKARNIFKRLSVILIMIIVSPLVVMVFFAGTIMYSHMFEYLGLDMEAFGPVKTILTWVLFAAIVTFTFSAMYKFIPKYKVEYGVAFRAAVFAAVAFTGMQFLYLETQLLVTRLNGVYGTFAAIPLFMVWLNISWNIILMGAELSYAFQHVDNYNLDD